MKYGYPSVKNRWCSKDKAMFINRETKNSIIAIGIAYDESQRMFLENSTLRTFIFPLIDFKMTEKDCLDYCKSLGFNFYSLYDVRDRVSCFCCPFIANKEIVYMPKKLEERIIEYESICTKFKHKNNKMFKDETFLERKTRLINKGVR